MMVWGLLVASSSSVEVQPSPSEEGVPLPQTQRAGGNAAAPAVCGSHDTCVGGWL